MPMLLISLLDCPTGIKVPLDRKRNRIKEVKVLSLFVTSLGLESRVLIACLVLAA